MPNHTISLTGTQEARARAALRSHYPDDLPGNELVNTYLTQALQKFVLAEERRTKEATAIANVTVEPL